MDVLDLVAPVTSSKLKPRSEPWIDENIRSLRPFCRRVEFKWKKDRLQISFEILKDSLSKFQKAVRAAKSRYFAAIIDKNYHRPKTLFTIFNTVVNPTVCEYPDASKTMFDDFLRYFINKISDIMLGISPPAFDSSISSAELNQFEPISFIYLQEIVCQLKPSGSSIDAIPPHFFKQVFDALGPYFVTMINRCLDTSIVPDVLKHNATVYPLLKRPNLDPSVLANYRPISNLSFISKILEKVVLQQLQSFLDENKIFEIFQSGFRKHHSTETTLLKVLNDILLTGDSGHLEHCVGIKGSALEWFNSYLSNRSFRVNIGEHSSEVASLSCGVPQGSILAPILFSLYMLPLGSIFRKHGLSSHCYADDTKIYLPLKQSSNGLEALMFSLSDVKA
uniref:Reverse transcriptase domain-containing protein n=1 Tax=Cyprinus carpio TaxID=7962 RepID=A0A8C2KHR2_CYPCA